MRLNLKRVCVSLVAALSATAGAGCSAAFYREQADRDVYRIIESRQAEELGHSHAVNIRPQATLAEELARRGYESDLSPEALGLGEPDSTGPGSGPRVVSARPVVPQAMQMSAIFEARVDAPPVGVLVDAVPAPGSEPTAGQVPTTQPMAVPTTQAIDQVEIPPISGSDGLFIDPGQWPERVRKIDLLEALQLAALHSRPFQQQKESVYLAALNLTSQRHTFEMQFFGTVDGELAQTGRDTRQGSLDSEFGFTRNFTTGGAMALSLSNTLFAVFTDPSGKTASSAINLTLSQPILRGAGYRVAAEPLIQANREVTYAVREFERFKRELAVSIATNFYRVLQQGDEVANERNNYAMLILARQRSDELARAGRLPQFQVDQASQDELRARNRWVVAVSRYNQAVDDFRRTLGLPTDWPIVPDPAGLRRLAGQPINLQMPGTIGQLVGGALRNRLDLKTAKDEVEDAARQLFVTADALRTGLDLSASATMGTNAFKNRPLDFVAEEGSYSIAALLDLPLDRLDERNSYRSAIITLHSRQRSLTNLIDQVTQEVRESVRAVSEAENSHRIQKSALTLALRRVDSTALLLQAGRADTRDLLEAQDALVGAQNAVTAAVVDYHISRLELLRDTEMLQVEPAGLSYHDSTTNR